MLDAIKARIAARQPRAKAANEYKLHTVQARVRSAEDALFVSFTNAVHRLTRPDADARRRQCREVGGDQVGVSGDYIRRCGLDVGHNFLWETKKRR